MSDRPSIAAVWIVCSLTLAASAAEPIARWELIQNGRDSSGHGRHAAAQDVRFESGGARFNGRTSLLTVPAEALPPLGTGDFSISVWVHTEAVMDDIPGDIISHYDPDQRRGFHLGLASTPGVTSSQSMSRQLQFGIDNARSDLEWTDHGRLGDAVLIFSLCVHDGQLFAGTCVPEADQAGHVYRFDGRDWHDCGAVDRANSVSTMAVFNGQLYVASSKYRLRGSALAESENPHLGGKVFRYVADGEWEPCGTLPETEAVGSLAVYNGRLYASTMYLPAGFFRYEGGTEWTACETPGKRVESLSVHNGHMYATGWDEGAVYRYDGEHWEHLGVLPEATQTYGFAVYEGELYVSEWPHARVYRLGPNDEWIYAGRLGEELESMPLMVYNGKMYCGTLPLAEVYRYDGGEQWTRMARLDHTPDVKYRRVWSMAVYNGRLFAGTLPSGRVHSIEFGKCVTSDRELQPGWRHVAAVRDGRRLKLYVDGELVAASSEFEPDDYDLTTSRPLRIGSGPHDHFNGRLSDLRLLNGALTADEVRALAHSRPSGTQD